MRGVNVVRVCARGFMRDFARGGERVDEFCARSLSVCEQARDVAPVHAAARDEQVVARAARDAAQLQLARRGRGVLARRRACKRQPRVALDALARGEQRVPPGLAVGPARAQEQVLDFAERVDGRAPDALDPLLVVSAALVNCLRLAGSRSDDPQNEPHRRQGPRERRGCRLRERARAARAALAVFDETGHAEGRCRREVDDCEFAQKHGDRAEGQRTCQLFVGSKRDAATAALTRAGAGFSRVWSGARDDVFGASGAARLAKSAPLVRRLALCERAETEAALFAKRPRAESPLSGPVAAHTRNWTRGRANGSGNTKASARIC